ncbi:MAG: homocysteine S-methyltransferase family protein, partial [Actinomycetota bacterium]|nr:homocysteine S-methyltransferase family protein [Actinomycetota bacterium]
MDSLPQLAETVFLTDSGLETDLIFHHGYDLPDFAAFVLLDDASGVEALRRYYRDHATIARDAGVGFVLESPTWRASPDWGERLGYPPARLADVNRRAIALLVDLRAELENEVRPVVISGCVGPRGDGYRPAELMSADDAQRYHATQIATFAATEADLVTAMTITYVEEAIGIARAARQADVPVVISFTVETDGRLPNGSSLEDAVRAVDQATDRYPAYYMVNCAHPSHFSAVLDDGGDWTSRLRGVR